jgi:DNA-binding MarR family transcriptional regulator
VRLVHLGGARRTAVAARGARPVACEHLEPPGRELQPEHATLDRGDREVAAVGRDGDAGGGADAGDGRDHAAPGDPAHAVLRHVGEVDVPAPVDGEAGDLADAGAPRRPAVARRAGDAGPCDDRELLRPEIEPQHLMASRVRDVERPPDRLDVERQDELRRGRRAGHSGGGEGDEEGGCESHASSSILTDELALCQAPSYDRRVRREWNPDAALLQELYSAAVLVELLVEEELAAAGVRSQLFSFLGWVALLEPVTPGTLAAETGMPPTTIRDYVRRLSERGDVRKQPNPADGRSYHLVLTAQGRRLVERGAPAVAAAFARLEPALERPAREHLAAVEELRRALKSALAR